MLESRKDITNIEKKKLKKKKKSQPKKILKKREKKKKPKPGDCCSEGDLIAAVADRVGVAAGARRLK